MDWKNKSEEEFREALQDMIEWADEVQQIPMQIGIFCCVGIIITTLIMIW